MPSFERPRSALLLTAALVGLVAPASAQQRDAGTWTKADRDRVADLTISAAGETGMGKARNLLDLADALASGGDAGRAAEVAGAFLASLPARAGSGPEGDQMYRERAAAILVRAGARAEALRIAADVADPGERAGLLGAVGVQLARDGDTASAMATARELAALAAQTEPSAVASSAFGNRVRTAQTFIGNALADAGDLANATQVAATLPEGRHRTWVLSRVALDGCAAGHGAFPGARAALDEALRPAPWQEDAIIRFAYLRDAAAALAACEGAPAALSFAQERALPGQLANVVSQARDALRKAGQAGAAEGLRMPADESTPEGLLEEAREELAHGNSAGAAALAGRAAALEEARFRPVQAGTDATYREQILAAGADAGHSGLLGSAADVLIATGHSQEAVSLTALQSLGLRQQYLYGATVRAADRSDVGAVAVLLPAALAALRGHSGLATGNLIANLTAALARSGSDQSSVAYKATLAAAGDPERSVGERPVPFALGGAMTAMGDIADAMALADRAGPLVAPPSLATAYIAALMSMGKLDPDARQPSPTPDPAALAERAAQARRMMPATVAGPKAGILAAIAEEAARGGRIDAAVRAEAALEADPRDALAAVRDRALEAIAAAMLKAGDPEGSLSAAGRISNASERCKHLIALARLPVPAGGAR